MPQQQWLDTLERDDRGNYLISTVRLRLDGAEIVSLVNELNVTFVLTHNGRPMAAVIHPGRLKFRQNHEAAIAISVADAIINDPDS